ncbi:hypothetical protein [Leisingera methylohalidivorans]|uniref:hypothetical protein n=1 Tax=Leisingera methylohalidivorans TaxID=133924 RepID=UPI0012EB4E53|nr:hypothetical protein [Leisingera methylohalidivorans]
MNNEIMAAFFDAMEPAFWALNAGMLLLAVAMRQMRIPKIGWALFGILLVACAGMAIKMSTAANTENLPLSIILATVTWGGLGARFIGNWLTDRAS